MLVNIMPITYSVIIILYVTSHTFPGKKGIDYLHGRRSNPAADFSSPVANTIGKIYFLSEQANYTPRHMAFLQLCYFPQFWWML